MEKYQENALLKLGWEKVTSWECLYFHRAKQLFLSCYVDDYKMAGKKENIAPMWDSLRKEGIDIEPPVPVNQNVYLGCGQKVIKPNMALKAQKREMFQRICASATLVRLASLLLPQGGPLVGSFTY